LANLVILCLASFFLQVDARIARPRRFENLMTALNAGTAKEHRCNRNQPNKPDVRLIAPQFFQRRIDCHK
jgi:hypothetical protein